MRLDELADAAFLSGGHADSPHASGFIGVPFASANALYNLSKLSAWWLRLGICTRAHRQPVRARHVTHVVGMIRHLCDRNEPNVGGVPSASRRRRVPGDARRGRRGMTPVGVGEVVGRLTVLGEARRSDSGNVLT